MQRLYLSGVPPHDCLTAVRWDSTEAVESQQRAEYIFSAHCASNKACPMLLNLFFELMFLWLLFVPCFRLTKARLRCNKPMASRADERLEIMRSLTKRLQLYIYISFAWLTWYMKTRPLSFFSLIMLVKVECFFSHYAAWDRHRHTDIQWYPS